MLRLTEHTSLSWSETFVVDNVSSYIVTTALPQSVLYTFLFCFLNFAETYVTYVSNTSHVVGNIY